MDRLSARSGGTAGLGTCLALVFFCFSFLLWENLLELAPGWVKREREGEARIEVDCRMAGFEELLLVGRDVDRGGGEADGWSVLYLFLCMVRGPGCGGFGELGICLLHVHLSSTSCSLGSNLRRVTLTTFYPPLSQFPRLPSTLPNLSS